MKRCCLAISVRGPQHLMEVCGNSLPRSWSVVELSEKDEVIDISPTDLEGVIGTKPISNHVVCHYSQSLEIHLETYSQIPHSEFLRDVLVFNDTHWKSTLCQSQACCPSEGKPYSPMLTTCRAIRAWQDALADWILGSPHTDEKLVETLLNLDVRDWILSRASTSQENDWVEFIEFLTESHENVSLYTILAGFHYAKSNSQQAKQYLEQASSMRIDYPLRTLLERGLESSMPADVLIQSLRKFEQTKQKIVCLHEASLLPKASPPTATRTGER